jgi:Zn-finger nucleic acid-binding protein
MIVVEHNKIELDYCTSCQGVWFDSGELELFLNSMGPDSRSVFLGNILNSQEVQSTEKKRKCPICGKKMKKTIIGRQPEILIDVCQRGDGLWFDSGEVISLIKQVVDKTPAKEDAQQQILGFLGEVFKA